MPESTYQRWVLILVAALIAVQGFVGVQAWGMNGRLYSIETSINYLKSNVGEMRAMERRIDKLEEHRGMCLQYMRDHP